MVVAVIARDVSPVAISGWLEKAMGLPRGVYPEYTFFDRLRMSGGKSLMKKAAKGSQ